MGLKTTHNSTCYLKVLSQDKDLNYDVLLAVMRSGVNNNRWNYHEVEKYAHTFLGTPILCAYPEEGKVGDGHNMREKRKNTGEKFYDFTFPAAERIVGMIGENAADVWTEQKGEETWVFAKGKLWRFYNQQLVDKIAKQGRMDVSAETEVTNATKNDGIEDFWEWRGIGVTILGDKVAPAIPGANIQAIKAMSETFTQAKLAAASYHPEKDLKEPKNNEEGVEKTLEKLNKQQCEKIQARFEGYVVLAASKNTETGEIHVALRNDKWELFRYNMASENENITVERIVGCSAVADFGDGLTGDLYAMVEKQGKEMADCSEKLKAANDTIASRDEQIKAMQETENKRRVSCAKETAKATLSAFNSKQAEKVEDAVLDAVNADIDSGVYTNCVDKDGAWCGDKKVEDAVYALCARKMQKMAEEKAEASKRVMVSDKLAGGNVADDGSVNALLERKNIR